MYGQWLLLQGIIYDLVGRRAVIFGVSIHFKMIFKVVLTCPVWLIYTNERIEQ